MQELVLMGNEVCTVHANCTDLQQLASFPLGSPPLAQLLARKLAPPQALQAHHTAAVQQESLACLVAAPVALDAQGRSVLPALM